MDNSLGDHVPPEINERYVIKKEIGKGAYGTVYLAVDQQTGQKYVWMSCFIVELPSNELKTFFELEPMPSGLFAKSPFSDSAIIQIFAS